MFLTIGTTRGAVASRPRCVPSDRQPVREKEIWDKSPGKSPVGDCENVPNFLLGDGHGCQGVETDPSGGYGMMP